MKRSDDRVSREHSEQDAVRALRKLARYWPRSLWIFSADGKLFVMRRGGSGERMYVDDGTGSKGVDQHYIVTSVDIPSDGGDW